MENKKIQLSNLVSKQPYWDNIAILPLVFIIWLIIRGVSQGGGQANWSNTISFLQCGGQANPIYQNFSYRMQNTTKLLAYSF